MNSNQLSTEEREERKRRFKEMSIEEREEIKRRFREKCLLRKERTMLSSLKNMVFCDYVSKNEVESIGAVLRLINTIPDNGYYSMIEPKMVIYTSKFPEENVKKISEIICQIQEAGKWYIPSPLYEREFKDTWYEVDIVNTEQAVQEVLEHDYLTIFLKEKNTLVDVSWEEDYPQMEMYSAYGVYCIYIEQVTI